MAIFFKNNGNEEVIIDPHKDDQVLMNALRLKHSGAQIREATQEEVNRLSRAIQNGENNKPITEYYLGTGCPA